MIKLMLSYSEIISASLALVLAAPATAMAAPPAAWVSGQGTNEAGCGSQQSPCATFQYVHDNILGPDGGDIVVLGAGVYGAGTLNITKPLSILNDSAGTAAVGAGSGPAISINVPMAASICAGSRSTDWASVRTAFRSAMQASSRSRTA